MRKSVKPFISNCMCNRILNNVLCNFPCKIPINKSHYVTGKNLFIFSKLMCVENVLSNIGCCCNNLCNSIFGSFKNFPKF